MHADDRCASLLLAQPPELGYVAEVPPRARGCTVRSALLGLQTLLKRFTMTNRVLMFATIEAAMNVTDLCSACVFPRPVRDTDKRG